MELNYSLDENDYLKYQLFTASKSKLVKNQILKTYIYVFITAVVVYFALFKGMENGFLRFAVYSIIMFSALPFYLKWKYKSHYRKNIQENYKERFGEICKLKFEENQIVETSKIGESKINYESLSEINEVRDYYFLKLLTGGSVIIPKKNIPDISKFRTKLAEIRDRFNLKENINLNWK